MKLLLLIGGTWKEFEAGHFAGPFYDPQEREQAIKNGDWFTNPYYRTRTFPTHDWFYIEELKLRIDAFDNSKSKIEQVNGRPAVIHQSGDIAYYIKCLDCEGQELAVGDKVAFASKDSIERGVVTAISNKTGGYWIRYFNPTVQSYDPKYNGGKARTIKDKKSILKIS